MAPQYQAQPHEVAQWHLDKRVPLALIFALLFQFAGFVWFAAGANSRINETARRVTKLEISDGAQAQVFSTIAERLARIEERLIAVQAQQQREQRRDDTMGRAR